MICFTRLRHRCIIAFKWLQQYECSVICSSYSIATVVSMPAADRLTYMTHCDIFKRHLFKTNTHLNTSKDRQHLLTVFTSAEL